MIFEGRLLSATVGWRIVVLSSRHLLKPKLNVSEQVAGQDRRLHILNVTY